MPGNFTASLSILCFLFGSALLISHEEFAERANKFGVNLFLKISNNTSGNIIVSPLSLELLLAQISLGAGGNTSDELQLALNLPEERKDVLESHKQVLESLKRPELNVASRLFVEQGFQIKQDFKDDLKSHFSSDAESLNFAGEPESSRRTINRWVEEETKHKIPELLSEGTITSSTVMAMVNAIHFKAEWLDKFPSRKTRKDLFFITPEKTNEVEMMNIKENFKFKHHSELESDILELPYKAKDFRMVVILPNEKDGLPKVLGKLSSFNLAEELQTLYSTDVNLFLPKFKLEETMQLNTVLTNMGLENLFSNANFTGISENDNLALSLIIQKAVIELDEEGTEAAAASGGIFLLTGGIPKVTTFRADHPFCFFIFYKDLICFEGCVRNI